MSTSPHQNQGSGDASTSFRISAASCTDVGREREVNEDAFFVDPGNRLFLVCDGMGGHTNGQLASQMAVHSIINTVDAVQAAGIDNEPLVVGIEAANNAIFQHAESNPECRGMGTTAIGLRIDGDRAHVCHVGDSRLYRSRGTSFQQLTRDHSLRNLYADKPELEGRLGPATTNVIVRAVGLEPQVQVDHRVLALEGGDLFLLCCDGLSDLVTDENIAGMLASDEPLEDIARRMVAAANTNGGTDNITVILIAVDDKDGGFRANDKTTLGF